MKNFGILFSIIAIIAVFLPWLETSSVTQQINNDSFNINIIELYGISTSFGKLGIVLGIISVLMFYFEKKFSLLPGYTMVFIGLIYIFEIIQRGETTTSSLGNYASTVSYIYEIKLGMYLFLVSGIFCTICGFKFLTSNSKNWPFSNKGIFITKKGSEIRTQISIEPIKKGRSTHSYS